MFGSSDENDQQQEQEQQQQRRTGQQNQEQIKKLRNEMTSKVNSVKSDMKQLHNSIEQLNQRIDELEGQIESVDTQDEYKVSKLEDDMSQTERELRNSISAIRSRQNNLEDLVENEYKPQLEREQSILGELKQMMKNIRDRLGTYGNIQDTVRTATHDIDRMKAELDTKVGHTELEEFQQETREDIQRLKSRIERLEEQF
ncbi:MAG: hypothetical protein MUP66_03780 [Candidatus Nanohaloarchaeota archaeon QJJ-5]|nr:hypothetical protein [Candidatus Nanohaloarchaeota archaeon QJJ-5]